MSRHQHQQLSTFTLFPYLPTELRLQIFRDCCTPRVVQLSYSPRLDLCRTVNTPTPAVLHVCKESRAEALRAYYLKCFGTRARPDPEIYFAPALDVLYVPRDGLSEGEPDAAEMGYDHVACGFSDHIFVPSVVELDGCGTMVRGPVVRRLAVDYVPPLIRRPWETYNKYCLMRAFEGLEEAFLIFNHNGSGVKVEEEDEDRDRSLSKGYGREERLEIEFIDPQGEREAIMQLMEGVRESFSFEVGIGVDVGLRSSATPTATSSPSEVETREDEWGYRTEGQDDDHHHQVGAFTESSLMLIPKTKTCHSWQHQQGGLTVVRCA